MATRTPAKPHMFQTAIDLPEKVRIDLVGVLNQQLADTFDLYGQLKQAHWNVKGRDFYQLHQLFDVLAECALEWADLLGERVTALGGYAMGTVRMSASSSRLPEFPTDIREGMDFVRALVERYGNYCGTTRAGITATEELGDPTTSDLMTEISRDADKNLYFLESHLQA